MNKFIFTFCVTALTASLAFAQNNYENNFGYDPNEYVDEAVDLEELASRRTVISPQQYGEYLVPIYVNAAQTAQSLNEKEAKLLISSQNRLNREMARISGETPPEEIDVAPTDTEALQKIVTPTIYTYDDKPLEP